MKVIDHVLVGMVPGAWGRDYIHYPLRTQIKVYFKSMSDKNLQDNQYGRPTFFKGLAGKCRLVSRKPWGGVYERISSGLWVIAFQWRRDFPLPGADPNKWESWRHHAVYPMRFSSNDECEDYLFHVMKDTFQNLTGKVRKPSASSTSAHVVSHRSRVCAGVEKPKHKV